MTTIMNMTVMEDVEEVDRVTHSPIYHSSRLISTHTHIIDHIDHIDHTDRTTIDLITVHMATN